eukprot:tig00000402_g221.t1
MRSSRGAALLGILALAHVALGALNSAPTTGGRVFVTGIFEGLTSKSAVRVTVGGAPCLHPYAVVPGAELSCTIGEGVGAGLDVVIQDIESGAKHVAKGAFAYDAPVVHSTSFAPPVGGHITIRGENFGAVGTPVDVTVGGKKCTDATVTVPHREIACHLEAGKGANIDVDVQVGGQGSGPSGYGKLSYFVPWAIITTINPPTDDVRKVAAVPGWQIVVVADKKTPKNWSLPEYPNVHFLSVEDQEKLPYATRKLLPWNTYMRKNVGYLYAIERGATVVYETDDDNALLQDHVPVIEETAHVATLEPCNPAGPDAQPVVNPYAYFGHRDIWPRGYPLQHLGTQDLTCTRRSAPLHAPGAPRVSVPVQQYLADADPDLDAVFRLVKPKLVGHIHFAKRDPVAVRRGLMVPYNTQNTVTLYQAFWGLWMPTSVNWRVSDIWRGYVAQAILWRLGARLAFGHATAVQVRNPHSYLHDFEEEMQLYLEAGKLVEFLRGWEPSEKAAGSVKAMMVELGDALLARKHWSELDANITRSFAADLEAVGYRFPLVPKAPAAPARPSCGGAAPYVSFAAAALPGVDSAALQAFADHLDALVSRHGVAAELVLAVAPGPDAIAGLVLPSSLPVRFVRLAGPVDEARAREAAVRAAAGEWVLPLEPAVALPEDLGRLLGQRRLKANATYSLPVVPLPAGSLPADAPRSAVLDACSRSAPASASSSSLAGAPLGSAADQFGAASGPAKAEFSRLPYAFAVCRLPVPGAADRAALLEQRAALRLAPLASELHSC